MVVVDRGRRQRPHRAGRLGVVLGVAAVADHGAWRAGARVLAGDIEVVVLLVGA
jgi:hypothetical protein